MKIKRLPNRSFNHRVIPEVGSKIKTARHECGLTQKELAVAIGLKTGTAICLWEKNERGVECLDLWKISQVTNLPITFFI